MIFEGNVHVVGDHCDNDVMIPGRYLSLSEPAEIAKQIFEEVDPGFVKRGQPCDILMAGRNFGSGSGREHAPFGLKALGLSCIVAASFILLAVAFNLRESKRRFQERRNAIFCALGVFIYAGTGYLSFLYSGNFLDYGQLSNLLPTDPIKARYYGMAMIELGVQITVMAAMVSILLDLITAGKHEITVEDDGK